MTEISQNQLKTARIPGCCRRRWAKGVRSLFSFSGLFRSLFLTLLPLFSSLSCQTPFARLLLQQSENSASIGQNRFKVGDKLATVGQNGRFSFHAKVLRTDAYMLSKSLTLFSSTMVQMPSGFPLPHRALHVQCKRRISGAMQCIMLGPLGEILCIWA